MGAPGTNGDIVTASIGAGGSLPRADITSIERRVKDEFQAEVDGAQGDLQRELASAEANYDRVLGAHERQLSTARSWDVAKVIGGGVAVGAALLGTAGAVMGGSGSRLAAGGVGAAIGAAAGMVAAGAGLWFQDFADSLFGIDDDPGLPDTPEFRAAHDQVRRVKSDLDHLPDPERIEPGAAWLNVPRAAEHGLGVESRVEVAAWTDRILAAHDHDQDGEIRLGDSSQSPRNELLRSAVGGPFQAGAPDEQLIARARELPLAEQRQLDTDGDGALTRSEIISHLERARTTEDLFGLTAPQLARYDSDGNDGVSGAELAEGMVRDGATQWHGGYYITHADGTVPRTILDGRDDRPFQAYG